MKSQALQKTYIKNTATLVKAGNNKRSPFENCIENILKPVYSTISNNILTLFIKPLKDKNT